MKKSGVTKTKVTHLTSVHRPFDHRIFHKECKTLVAAGYEVTLIAPHENDEIVDGVQVRAVPKATSRSSRMIRTVWQVFRTALGESSDFYHFHDPELIPVGLLLKLYGLRVLYDIHEEVPEDILGKAYIPTLLARRLVARLAAATQCVSAAFFDGIISANPNSSKRFPAKKTALVQNFPSPTELEIIRPVPYDARPLTFTYIGDITLSRGIKEMIQAVSLLANRFKSKLVLAGSFSPPDLQDEVKQMGGWNLVEFVGWQGRDGLARILSTARVGLVVLHPTPAHKLSYASKMFEYMLAGIPVVSSDFPLWRSIIDESNCGLLVDPLDPKGIADAIAWLFENPKDAEAMGRRGRQAVLSRYNWNNEAVKLLELYRRLC